MPAMTRMKEFLRLRRDERGSASIEFVITFPIIILATLIIFDIGRATQMMSTLSNAANDTVRYASAHATDNLIPKTETEIIAFANTRLTGVGSGSAITVTFTPPAGADPADPDFVSGGEVSIRITQTLDFFTFGFIGRGPQQFIGRADMIVL
jgi:Flp pilus assembly protein TadG